MIPVIEAFKKSYKLKKLVVIADSGLLSNDNIEQLESAGHEFILGARIRAGAGEVKDKILALDLEDGQSAIINLENSRKLIISYSSKRARKDEHNRQFGLKRLEKKLGKGKLTKQHINNHGYNKFLTMEGEVEIKINHEKIVQESRWDGLKGYITNSTLSKEEVIENYRQLWQIEKAFRISKTDLRIRPVYHRVRRRIEAHICIAFCAYKIYKEFERQLKEKQVGLSPEKALDILKTIYGLKMVLPQSKELYTHLIAKDQEQIDLLKAFGI
jgi:transposase